MRDDAPEVNMTHERMFCARHGEPFRAQYPKGFATGILPAFQRYVETRYDGDIADMDAHLDEKPLCCRLSTPDLLQMYVDADIGRKKRCKICGRREVLGTAYQVMQPDRTIAKIPHVCFSCVLTRMEPHG